MIIWASLTDKTGKNIGVICLEADNIRWIQVPDEIDPTDIEGYNSTPKNVFMSKEEMAKHIELEKW